jgi:hypothetical protein
MLLWRLLCVSLWLSRLFSYLIMLRYPILDAFALDRLDGHFFWFIRISICFDTVLLVEVPTLSLQLKFSHGLICRGNKLEM